MSKVLHMQFGPKEFQEINAAIVCLDYLVTHARTKGLGEVAAVLEEASRKLWERGRTIYSRHIKELHELNFGPLDAETEDFIGAFCAIKDPAARERLAGMVAQASKNGVEDLADLS